MNLLILLRFDPIIPTVVIEHIRLLRWLFMIFEIKIIEILLHVARYDDITYYYLYA